VSGRAEAGGRVAAGAPGPARTARLDARDQLAAAALLPVQLEAGYTAGVAALTGRPLVSAARPDGVVVCGMGGSAIGADVVGACLPELTVPYHVVRGYELPAWASANTLVVAVSYSGNTEEALSCVGRALPRGCRPVCVASGGRLAELAHERDLPLVMVPAGLQPRASLGYLAAPVAAALEAAGVARGFDEQVAEAIEVTRDLAAELAPEVGDDDNRAKQIARRMVGRLPLIYGAGMTVPAARRWKGQLNENAKTPAFFNELPELDHNELAGWETNPALGAQALLVLLDDPPGDERLRLRMALTGTIVAPRVAGVVRVASRGVLPLARVLSSVCVGDFTSLYLALLYGVDPEPVAAIEDLKARLAAEGGAAPVGRRRAA
jgi:glucose/mannose-6-phosphate isomerase